MVVPYNMLHFGKPMPEALAAIVGGIVLGTLSLKTRSIWWGAALHISIALTMDVCALVHMGRVL
jgi:membrane protease YdiL (CAAX protease family)